MPWTTASAELRTILSDQGTDRLRFRKRCIGRTNGTNVTFSTLEFRRVSNLATDPAPVGVFVNDVVVTVAADNPAVGQFDLTTAPAINTEVRATYYYQWFLDTELDTFVTDAVFWLGPGTDVTQIPEGLRPAVLQYAASLAYQKLAIRWTETWGMVFKLEDTKQDPKQVQDGYTTMAKSMRDNAETLRKQFYSRQDQGEQPIFMFVSGTVRDPVPKR